MKMMKTALVAGAIISLPFLSGCGVRKVDYGNRGVVVNTAGDDRGVSNETYSPGWILLNPMTHELYEFPVTQLNRTWTSSPHEGRSVDESIAFPSAESARCNADIYVAYQFESSKIPYIVRKYKMNADDITDNFIRSQVRAQFSRYSAKMKAIDIAGVGQTELTDRVREGLNRELASEGIHFNQVNIIGKVRLPGPIQSSIDDAIAATQQAIAAENRKRITQAVADQAVIQAEGDKRAIAANPNYLEQKKIEGWISKGCKIPTVMGSGINSFADMTKFLK